MVVYVLIRYYFRTSIIRHQRVASPRPGLGGRLVGQLSAPQTQKVPGVQNPASRDFKDQPYCATFELRKGAPRLHSAVATVAVAATTAARSSVVSRQLEI